MEQRNNDDFKYCDDLDLLMLLVWGEARGETFDGKLAVAWVARNRREDPRWPDDWRDVILQPKQFSCFNPEDPNYTKLVNIRMRYNDAVLRECKAAAFCVMHDWVRDLTKGANHYYRPKNNKIPYWAADKVHKEVPLPYLEIGNHRFLRL